MKKYIDFTLKNSNGKEITISEELKNNKVFLLFYRGTFWGVWVKQMAQVRHLKTEIDNTGTKVYAISVDGAEKASAMKRKTRFDYDILCDEKLEVINLYGLVDDE